MAVLLTVAVKEDYQRSLINVFQGKVSLNRIQSYLNKEELNDEAVTRNVNTGKFN
jgi:hypothetical protein